MVDEIPRSRQARLAAETALVRVVHHYGDRPEFVVLGGLIPELLCSGSVFQHAGTTDVDVQVNLEIAYGAVSASRLESALRNADFVPSTDAVWRWQTEGVPTKTIVKSELLADLDDSPAEAIIEFEDCDELGAVNLRGFRRFRPSLPQPLWRNRSRPYALPRRRFRPDAEPGPPGRRRHNEEVGITVLVPTSPHPRNLAHQSRDASQCGLRNV